MRCSTALNTGAVGNIRPGAILSPKILIIPEWVSRSDNVGPLPTAMVAIGIRTPAKRSGDAVRRMEIQPACKTHGERRAQRHTFAGFPILGWRAVEPAIASSSIKCGRRQKEIWVAARAQVFMPRLISKLRSPYFGGGRFPGRQEPFQPGGVLGAYGGAKAAGL